MTSLLTEQEKCLREQIENTYRSLVHLITR